MDPKLLIKNRTSFQEIDEFIFSSSDSRIDKFSLIDHQVADFEDIFEISVLTDLKKFIGRAEVTPFLKFVISDFRSKVLDRNFNN